MIFVDEERLEAALNMFKGTHMTTYLQGRNDRKLKGKHTDFLCNFYKQNTTAAL